MPFHKRLAVILSVWCVMGMTGIPSGLAQDWNLDLTVSVPDPAADSGIAVHRLTAGISPDTTDLFDNQADAIALLSGPAQAAFSHEGEPEYPPHLRFLWRDWRGEGFPQQWILRVASFQSDFPIAIDWSNLTADPENSCTRTVVQLEDQTTAQVIDMTSQSSFVYTSTGSGADPEIRLFNLLVDKTGERIPPAPTEVTAIHQRTAVRVSWSSVKGEAITGYYVWRRENEADPYQRLTQAPVTERRFKDRDVQPDKTYYYVVSSVGMNNCESEFSPEADTQAKRKHGR